MTSAINPNLPADGVDANKADLRASLLAAKTEIEALQTRFGGNTIVALDYAGATPAAKLTAALAAIAASAGSYRLIVPQADYVQNAQWVIPVHPGETTEVVGWGMPRVRRADTTGADKSVFFAAPPTAGTGKGNLLITGLRGENTTPSSAWFLIPSGELRSVKVIGNDFRGTVGGPDNKMIVVRANRGGIKELVISHNTSEGIRALLISKPENTDFGTLIENTKVCDNTCINHFAELCSIDRGNGGAHGPRNHVNVTVSRNHFQFDQAPNDQYAVVAISASENVICNENQINGYQASGLRFEDVSNSFLANNNTIRHGRGWAIAVSGKRWWEYCAIFILDSLIGEVCNNTLVDSVVGGIDFENNPSIGRAKRIILNSNEIVGAGRWGISIKNSPDSEAGISVDNDVFAPYALVGIDVNNNQIGRITKAFAATGLATMDQCGIGLDLDDFDVRVGPNRIYECDGPALWRTGRLPNGTAPIGPIDHTCLREIDIHPTAQNAGVRLRDDLARGSAIEVGGFVGWIDLMDIGTAATGTIDVGISKGDSNFARIIATVSQSGGVLTQTELDNSELGTLSGIELQLAADGRTVQARCASSEIDVGASHDWSLLFDGQRLVKLGTPAIIRARDYKMLLASLDGTNDWLGPDILAFAASKKALISARFQPAVNWDATRVIMSMSDGGGAANLNGLKVSIQSDLRIGVGNAATGLAMRSIVSPMLQTASAHLVVGIDTATQTGFMRLNEKDVLDVANTTIPLNINVATGDLMAIGWWANQLFPTNKFNGLMGDIWFDTLEGIALPTADAALAMFRSDYRAPKYLGEDGSVPLGVAPKVFVSAGKARSLTSYPTNRGSAGGFTLHGNLA